MAFRPELTMKAHRGDPLLGGGSRLPFRDQLLQPRLHRSPYRSFPLSPRTSDRLGLIEVLGYRVAA
jgi:hypothetical protein